MLLFFVTLIVILLVAWFVYKDRQYLKKSTRDVLSSEMKKRLNVPSVNDEFQKEIQRHNTKETPSKKILTMINDDKEL